MGGKLLVPNYRPCNKAIPLDAPAGPCEERPIFPKMCRATHFKIIFSQAPASFQPFWMTPSLCDDDLRDGSVLSIILRDCVHD